MHYMLDVYGYIYGAVVSSADHENAKYWKGAVILYKS